MLETNNQDKFWLADREDMRHVLHELNMFGYRDRSFAEEEDRQIATEYSVYEVCIRQHKIPPTI